MQFKIEIAGFIPDIDAIEHTIRAVDPSALADIDQAGEMIRVATSLDAVHLLRLMGQAGYPVAEDELERLPSECCGGCGG
ncbi:hypothetical protein [Pseudoxanthomonas sp. CF125]|uniref:hypothetical protein n=1 Tax=Pseudoxanthomonas sp. CF125 TaxID=1855303 RepID=UPI00088EAFB1|nr:hypothetical protein [Pseudoxanthomonas sp. CF125]SDR04015.1 hypothetical protein SAMN05216569_2776 [Pseudoxanthomonas sp. CF125]